MLVHLARRGVARFALLLAAGFAIFLLTRPLIADATSGGHLPAQLAELLAQLRARLGLELPILAQFADWMTAILGGDLGRSAAANAPVADLLWLRLPPTLHLLAAGLAIAGAIALPLGLIAARRVGGMADRIVRALAFLAEAMPMAGFALVLMLVFAILLRWLPASGHVAPSRDIVDAAAHLLLPATALAVGLLPLLLRTIRDSARAVRAERHIVVARAFGAGMRGRELRLALVPALASLAALLGQALSGAVLIESIFDLPGLGRLLVESIVARDYVLLRGLALASATVVVASALASDVLRALLDRRLRRAS